MRLLTRLFLDFFKLTRTCNGAREWISDNMINPSPEYECAATGQDHYRSFDGRWIKFHQESCKFTMMKEDTVEISVKNEPCRYGLSALIHSL